MSTPASVQFLTEARAYASIVSSLLARLSLIATYAFEPSFARTYYAIVFDPQGPIQQFNSLIPYQTLLRYTDSATILAFNYLKPWILGHPLSQRIIRVILPIWNAVRPFLPLTCLWIGVSTTARTLISGGQSYLERVQNPDYRFLGIAVLVLILYRYLVLKGTALFVRFVIWSTVAIGVDIVRRVQGLLDRMRNLLLVFEKALYRLLDLAYWSMRLLSVLVLFAVDWFMSTLAEVDKLEADATTPQPSPSGLSRSQLIRKALVWAYVGYVCWISWRPISRWIWSFRIMRLTWLLIRLCALTIWEAIYLIGSIIYGVIAGFVVSIANWLCRFWIVRFLLRPVVLTCTTALRVVFSAYRLFRRLGLLLNPFRVKNRSLQNADQTLVLKGDVFHSTTVPGQYPMTPGKRLKFNYHEPKLETPRRSPRIESQRLIGHSPDYKF